MLYVLWNKIKQEIVWPQDSLTEKIILYVDLKEVI